MKRLQMLLVPLFAMPLLVGCKIGDLDDQHSLSFTCENCYVIIKNKKETDIAIFVNKDKTVEYTLEPDEGFTLPDHNVEFKNTETDEEFTDASYDSATKKVTIHMTANIAVAAKAYCS